MLIFLTTLLTSLASIFRSRASLGLENLALRHQIGVLHRSAGKRPKLTAGLRAVPRQNLEALLKSTRCKRGCVTCPIKGNVKRKNLPVGPMPTFFSRHSAHPFERPLLLPRVVLLGPKVQLRFRVRSGETLLPRGSIFATVTAPFVS